MEKNKILVTGGLGYIGSHTTLALQAAGYEVVIVDNLSNSQADMLDRIAAISGIKPALAQFDLCEEAALDQFFAEHANLGGIIHFAAFKAVGESVAQPLNYYKNNLLSLMLLLEKMQKYAVPYLVFSSSCTVYGEPESLPVTEAAPVQKATSPYGNTKQISEEIIQDVLKAQPALQAIALRYFNPVGAHESGQIGELPLGVPNNLMPFITQTAIGLRSELKVFGHDYDTPDGTCIRDYIHVMDLAEAHVIALQRLMEKKNRANYEFFNLGTGQGSTVLEVIASFERTSGQKLNYQLTERRPGDVVKIYADTALANEVLGWKARRNLDEMTRSAWQWEQNYRGQ
ncbi:MAG: UDP-glucose 4-epimerase GalE [Microscillaceae bacterium]|nr:UDP-glucose 4-epimerase GalE [Microscillaceae bacterium]